MEFDLSLANREWARLSPEGVINAARLSFQSGLVMSSGFGAESAAFLHMVTTSPLLAEIPVAYIKDAQTTEFAAELQWQMRLNLHEYSIGQGMTKAQTLFSVLKKLGATAVLHGIRRYQTDNRKAKQIVELGEDGIYRIHPILEWTPRRVAAYMRRHKLRKHPSAKPKVDGDECGIHCFVKATQ